MTDYLNLILNSFTKNRDSLSDILIQELKKAKENNIIPIDFYGNCFKTLDKLGDKLSEQEILIIKESIRNTYKYTHYLDTGRFGIEIRKEYKEREYKDFVSELKYLEQSFEFIINRLLNEDDRVHFVNRFKDQLIRLEKFQSSSMFKVQICKTISYIQNDNNIDLPPKSKYQNDNNNISINLYLHIFKGNAFKVFDYFFDEVEINESSRTDIKFIFEEMLKDGLIHKTIKQKSFLEWIEEVYGIIIEKTSNHNRTKQRISIYNNAKKFYKA